MDRHYQTPDKKHGGPKELLKWAEKARDFKEGRRFLCIRMLMMKGLKTSVNEAAEDFGVSVRTVNKWLRQWNEGGKEGLKTTPRRGRPQKFNLEREKRIRELIEKQKESKTRLTIKGIHGFLKE
ncbi:MAG: helix-turn-helix domain-containing protein [Candidatus Eremiobacteraeota bacterium]|nr:helix-turn-helix domain-containing protein [Candidatus Eremiobacteraeota bacterium]